MSVTKIDVYDDGRIRVERDCVVTHDGREFESGGAFITPERIVAYLTANPFLPTHSHHGQPARGIVTTWHGDYLGTYRIVSSWAVPGYFSSRRMSVRMVIDGTAYHGRSAGSGMIVHGKAYKAS